MLDIRGRTMDSVSAPYLPPLLALLILSAGTVLSGPCFQHHCLSQDDVVSCVSDPQNAWLCKEHETCELKAHGPDLTMRCTAAQSCSQDEQDQAQCPEVPTPQDLHHACIRCCPSRECVQHLLSQRTLSWRRASSPQTHPRPAPHEPHPEPHRHPHHYPEPHPRAHPEPHHEPHPHPHREPHLRPHRQPRPEPHRHPHHEPSLRPHPEPHLQPHSESHLQAREPNHAAHPPDHHAGCYSSHCGHGDNLYTCTSGTFLCQVDQYCDIHINHGNIDMACHSFLDHKRQECERQHEHNHAGCKRTYHPDTHDDCRYCCLYDSCVKDLMASSHNFVTPVGSHDPIPAPGSCFTTQCVHKDRAAQCLSGQWGCDPHHFCHFDVHAHGEIKMDCRPLGELGRCQADEQHHNRPACYDYTQLQAHDMDCHFCCQDANSVYTKLLGDPPSTTTTTTSTTTTPIPTTKTTTTTAKPTTTAMTSKLTTTMTKLSSATTVGVMSSTTVTSAMMTTSVSNTCTDTYTGNCHTTFPSMCHVPEVRAVCRLSCNACHETAQCVDSHHGNCAQDFSLALCHTSPVVANVCRKTCGLCSGSGSSSNISPAPPPSSANAPTQCVQCGDFYGGVPCSSVELTQNSPSPCKDPAASLCMTHVSGDGHGNTSIYKRCVDTTTCQDLWYRRTFQDSVCMTFDPLALTPDLTCHYCCHGDGCNGEGVPDHRHLWRP